MPPYFSVIVPVFNRPDEVQELLASLVNQTSKDFEVLIVEDGSTVKCESVCRQFDNTLQIRYFFKDNSGPGQSRNYGAERSEGEFLIILDSDCILPENYIESVSKSLAETPVDAFGGPDRAHEGFTRTQKAINYAMTSFLTTGGIRGGKLKLDRFFPRSFNMGIKKNEFLKLNGFSKMRFGEDIDLSLRIFSAGLSCRLFPEAWVYHKRRTDFRKFFKQVYNSGIARINLNKKHPGSMKLVHMLPAAFTIGVFLLILMTFFYWFFILPLAFYIFIVLIDSSIRNRSLLIGLWSVPAAFVQLTSYGTGFIIAFWKRYILGKDEFNAFRNSFYK